MNLRNCLFLPHPSLPQSLLVALTLAFGLEAAPPLPDPFDNSFERDPHGHYIVPTGSGRVFEVGPDRDYSHLGEVPMETLGAGDTIRLHWREAPYREKVLIGGQGTREEPIVLVGVPNSGGRLPIIDGEDATTRLRMRFDNEMRGVVTIDGPEKPTWIYVANLDIRNGRAGNSFTDSNGDTIGYTNQAAGVNAVRGEFIHILNCTITHCGNGIFNASYVDEDCIDSWCADGAYVTTDLLIEGCRLHDNGYVDRMYEHNVYIEALRPTVQYNYLGPIKEGSLGVSLKDRSSGLILRYNWIEGSRPLDLVETEFGGPDLYQAPEYDFTLVYGNVIIKTPGVANDRIIHYGGDHIENFGRYRKNTLYLYHNTIISQRNNSTLFGLSTGGESAVVRNNILYAAPEHAFYILDGQGSVTLEHNWISEHLILHQEVGGSVRAAHNVRGNDPGFRRAAENDFRLRSDAPAARIAAPLPEPVRTSFPVRFQNSERSAGESRANTDDAGAFGPTG